MAHTKYQDPKIDHTSWMRWIEENLTQARDFYRQLGWEVIGTNGWTYILRPTQFNHFKSYCLVRAYQQGKDLNRIIEIHQNQSEQLTRNQSAYQTLFNIPTIKIWVAEENNLVTGYLVVAEAYNKSGVI